MVVWQRAHLTGQQRMVAWLWNPTSHTEVGPTPLLYDLCTVATSSWWHGAARGHSMTWVVHPGPGQDDFCTTLDGKSGKSRSGRRIKFKVLV